VTIKQVNIYSPASIANLGPGFDVFGIAIDGLGDNLILEIVDEVGVEIAVEGVGSENIPIDPERNSAGAVLLHTIQELGLRHGFRVKINKGVPPSGGMGSSGASAAGVTVALNELLGLEWSNRILVKTAAQGEAAVAGSPHADNISASLFGGFIIVGEDWEIQRMDCPDIEIVVVVPDIFIPNKTKVARGLLPEKVPLKDAVHNIRKATLISTAIALKDPELFGRSISDRLVEPYRAEMIPNFYEIKKAAYDSGAYGCTISGGGPSLFAVGENIKVIGDAMVEAFGDIEAVPYYTRPSNLGARVI
jgi:homoserine kinase